MTFWRKPFKEQIAGQSVSRMSKHLQRQAGAKIRLSEYLSPLPSVTCRKREELVKLTFPELRKRCRER